MPNKRDIDHMDLHINAIVDEFPADRNIRERGGEITKALDIAPVDAQDILDYLDGEMVRVGNLDTVKIRTWIAEVRKPGATKDHRFIDMATLLEVDTLA